MPKADTSQSKSDSPLGSPDRSALAAISFRQEPWKGEYFTEGEIERAVDIYKSGNVHLRLSNSGSESVGVFGWLEDPESTDEGRVEVSVIAQLHRDDRWTVDGRATSKDRSETNGPAVAALILAALAERGDAETKADVAALLAETGTTAAVRLSRRDVRAGILHWGEGDVLGEIRLATLTRAADEDIAAVLRGAGLKPLVEMHPFDEIESASHGSFASPAKTAEGQEQAWAEFFANAKPAIESFGEKVSVEEGFGIELVTGGDLEGSWRSDEEDMDWFGFEFGVQLGSERVDILPDLADYLRGRPASLTLAELSRKPKGHKVPLKRRSGGYLAVDADRLNRVLSMLADLLLGNRLEETESSLEVHRLHAAQITASREGSRFFKTTPPALAEAAAALGAPPPKLAQVPDGFLADLRPYQEQGVAWLRFLREQDIGGVLADDMGLGKTVQTLCHLHAEKAEGRAAGRPTLIVAPKSVAPNWEAEAKKFAPTLTVLRLEGSKRRRYYEVLRHVDLVVVSYPVLLRDAELLANQPFHYVVLDEAHTIKNSSARVTQAAYSLDSRHRLALTGTPIENHLGELWSLFHFLIPGYLGDEGHFSERFRLPIENDRNETTMRHLSERVRPLMLRRTKDLVAKDLPPKTEIVQNVELAPEQVDLYEAVRAGVSKDLAEEIERRGVNASKILILDALLKLRQVCCHPRLLKLPSADRAQSSAKLDFLMENLPTMVDEGRRILIFSQFTSMISLIGAALDQAGINHQELTGSTKDRKALCDRFQNGEVPVFLISLRAGGTGITLTAADTVIHYDPWWNPALEAQATDRAHRIGQKNPIFVYKLISRGTIEEKIVMLQRKKRALFEGLLGGQQAQRLDFSEAELQNLLAPISEP